MIIYWIGWLIITLIYAITVAVIIADKQKKIRKLEEIIERQQRIRTDNEKEIMNLKLRKAELENKIMDLQRERREKDGAEE